MPAKVPEAGCRKGLENLMAVYVDDMEAPFGRLIMCHMIADTTQELLAMATKIGVRSKWIQKAGDAREHFDICKSKRVLAVTNGAIEITMRDLALKTRVKRERLKIERWLRSVSLPKGG
jgi:hypothetical protein